MEKFKKMLFNLGIWASVIAGYVAYAIVGGLCFLKADDEDIKATAKRSLIVVLIFLAIELFLMLFNYIGGLFSGYYGSSAYDFYDIADNLVSIAKVITVAVFAILELVSYKNSKNNKTNKEDKSEDAEVKD